MWRRARTSSREAAGASVVSRVSGLARRVTMQPACCMARAAGVPVECEATGASSVSRAGRLGLAQSGGLGMV